MHKKKKTPPSKGHVLCLIGEVKSSGPSSNYQFAYRKSFNRTPEDKQPIYSCHPSFTGRYEILVCLFNNINETKDLYTLRYKVTQL